MAYLLQRKYECTCNRFELTPFHCIGRIAQRNQLCLDNPFISKLHAIIEWHNGKWVLRDLSSNGTWLNNQRLVPLERVALSEGDSIVFAKQQDAQFMVADLSPPIDLLVNNLSETIDSQQRNDMSSHWQYLRKKFDCQPTVQLEAAAYQPLKLVFFLSADEETTWLDVYYHQRKVSLGARSHHYLTLNLARHLSQDIHNGILPSQQGWVDINLLLKELGIDLSHLNIQVHRARKQFATALSQIVPNATASSLPLIARFKGQLRLIPEQFTITKAKNAQALTS